MALAVAVAGIFVGVVIVAYETQFFRYCYMNDEKAYKLYASKTSYEEIRGKDEDVVVLPGCTPVLFWYLSRHGTRYPSESDSILMQNRLPELQKLIVRHSKDKLCETDYEAIRGWRLAFNPGCRDLTAEGELEQTRIAQRFMKRFPNFRNVENTRYDIRYMSGTRILSSLRSFLNGIWPTRNVELRNDDEMLFFDKSCPKWSRNQNRTVGKAEKIVSKHMSTLRTKIADRFGLSEEITSDDVDVMYNGCRYENAWFPTRKSPWCVVFDKSDLELLELVKDVEFYAKYGYESEINYEQACPIVRDIVDNFESAARDPNPKIAIRFSHSGAIVKLFARLGLFDDGVESILEFDAEMASKRKWRTSLMDPFSSNLCLILLKCDSEFRILSYLHENPIRLPVLRGKCDNPCPLRLVLDYYKPIALYCNIKDICKTSIVE